MTGDMTGFFRDRLAVALTRRSVRVSELTEVYLVHLLASFVHASPEKALNEPLVHRMADALSAPTNTERFRKFRELGDHALYACGFFSDHLERRGIAREYVVTMGGRAYVQAGDLMSRTHGAQPDGFGDVYDELAHAFDALARVLDDVRECTSLRTPQDIVRLYERWRRTGSPLLAARLEEEGVFPQSGGSKLVH